MLKLEKKTLIEIIAAIAVVVFVSLLGFLGYKYYLNDRTNNDNNEPVASASCEDLKLVTPEKVLAPTVPILESKLNKNASSGKEICSWSVNGTVSHKSVPVKEKCVYGGKIVDKAGIYKISLEVAENNCKLEKTITVN